MKHNSYKLFKVIVLLVLALTVKAQNNQWVWMNGSNTPNSLGSYGTQGVASPSNQPPCRYEASDWTDHNGKFWLYGGYETVSGNQYNDLWMYDPATNMWTWVNGPSVPNNTATYGTQGIPSPSNNPGPRKYGSATWVDVNNNLWLFGGFGPSGIMNDLWMYNQLTNQWVWMKGVNTAFPAGSYGTIGVAAASNEPSYRVETSATWVDNSGDLWFFGGQGNGNYNDLWRFNIASNNWTWMSGSQFGSTVSNWGSLGVAAPTNVPSGRFCYATWKDLTGNLWLFGGNDSSQVFNVGCSCFLGVGGRRNDLWKYDITANLWTWVSGDSSANAPGIYGTQCVPSVSNIPGARLETRSRWTDDCGNFWLFAGASDVRGTFAFNDLWKYNPQTNQWTWVSGASTHNQTNTYGTQTVPSPANHPGARMGMVAYRNKQGLWMFGGASGSNTNYYNDLWKYIPDKPTASFTATPTTGCSPLQVSFTDNSHQNCGDLKAWSWNFGDVASGIADTSTLQNPSHTFNAVGTYTVKLVVLNCLGIKDSTTSTITVNGTLNSTIAYTSASCGSSNGTASVTITAGTGPFTYTWSPTGGNASTASNLPGGHYTVTVSNGGCINKDTLTIGTIGAPPVTSPIVGTSTLCPNAAGISYSVINTAGSTYTWTVPGGATIASGQGTNSITVNIGATGGTITCIESNTCGIGAPVTFTVVTSTTPVTPPIAGSPTVCANATNTTYSVTNEAGSTYTWTATGGTIATGQGTNVVTINWGTTNGTVTCTQTSSCGTAAPVTQNIIINNPPVSSVITGTTPLCPNATNTTYSVTSNAGSTYTWAVPGGATIVSGQGTNTVTVNWGTTGGNVICTESNSCGSGTPVSFSVTINNSPVTSAITGPTPVCLNATGTTYSVTNHVGSVYNWSVPAGVTIFGQGTNVITVNLGTTGGTFTCTETNACGSGTPVTFSVTMSNLPITSLITGPSPLCPNINNTSYSVTNHVGSTYTWTTTGSATVTAGQGTNAININWGVTGGIITCSESNICGNATPVTDTVKINPLPATGAISGTTPVCPNANNIAYTVNNTSGSTYTWTVPPGATINSGQGTNSILVHWATTPGTITVTETNACGSGVPVTYTVGMLTLPTTSPISGANPACANTSGITYSVTNNPPDTYTWTAPGGATIISGQGTNSITLNWGNTGGVIICTESNDCGPGASVTMTVSFSNIPVTSTISGTSPVCSNQNGTSYSVTSHAGSTYTWTVPGGATIASGQGTNTVSIDWGANGGVVTCTESNLCGVGTPMNYTVVMNNIPVSAIISGPTSFCGNTTLTYSATNIGGTIYNWTVPANASIVSGQGSDNITVNWGNIGGVISLTESNACGSAVPVLYTVTVNPAPKVNFTANPEKGCSPLKVYFRDTSVVTGGATITSWNWIFGDGNVSSLKDPVNVYTNPGAYNVSLVVTTNEGCRDSMSVINMINVYPNPTASFTTADTVIYLNDPLVNFIDLSYTNIVKWHWFFGDTTTSMVQNPSHAYNDALFYNVMLVVTNKYGCIDTARKEIHIREDFTFYIPNTFTPNGDNLNETFQGVGMGIGNYEMYIFDRWGEQIYATNNYNQPWDGRVKGRGDIAQEDVYV